MSQLKELEQRYENVDLLIKATQKTIVDPTKSVAANLAEGDERSKQIAADLISGGASVAGLSAATLASLGTASTVTVAGLTVGSGLTIGTTAAALGGPIIWTIGGGVAVLGLIWKLLSKKAKAKKAREQKEALLKTIIEKQQAIINKLNEMFAKQEQEINNLREALQMMKDTEQQMRTDFAIVKS